MTAVFQRRLRATRLATASRAVERFNALGSYDRPDAVAFAAQVAPVVRAGQLVTARTTAAYVRRHTTATVTVDPAELTGAALRDGVEPDEVYQRPFGKIWQALGRGEDRASALDRGRAYLGLLVAADLALAMRATYVVAGGVRAWRRVADATACELCAAADGETYEQADQMGLHPWCGCTLEPETGDSTAAAADPGAIETHEHGELGAVLTAAGDHFSDE